MSAAKVASVAACVSALVCSAAIFPSAASAAPPSPVAPPAAQGTLYAIRVGKKVMSVGDSGPAVTFVQQRLSVAGLVASPKISGVFDAATAKAVSRLQEKFLLDESGQIDADTLSVLLKITYRNGVLPHQCLTSYRVLCVDKTQKTLRFVTGGSLSRPGVVSATLDARFGAGPYVTREGLFKVDRKVANDFSWISGTPMKYSMYFSGGQAVHHSDWFVEDGYWGGSLGCVNTRDLTKLAWVFARTPVGSRVYVYR